MFKRALVLAGAAVLAGLVIAGCSSDDTEAPPAATTKIRVVNASPDAGAIDVYIDTSASVWLQNLEYGQSSTYSSRSTGTITLLIYEAGADPLLLPPYLTEDVDMVAGASLTVLATGLVQSAADEDKFRLIIYEDGFQNSPTARARVVHAGSDALDVQVTIGATGQVLASNLARWEESGRGSNVYEPRMIQDIVVQMADAQITSFRAPELEAQKDYYFFLIGLISGPGSATNALDLLIVGPGGALPLETIELRDFRMVHTSPDVGAVDYYLAFGLGDRFQRILMKDNVIYGDATDYGQLGIRQVNVEMFALGADPDMDQPLFSQAVYIHDEAASTTAFAAGLAASQESDDTMRIFSLADSFGVTPGGFLPARLVHTCANLDSLEVDFGDDGSIEAKMYRFTGNTEGWISLVADTGLTMVVREMGLGGAVVDVFTTAAMAADRKFYLILTGLKDGTPEFSLLSVTEEQSLGFTPPD
jgi:hypothetical protein